MGSASFRPPTPVRLLQLSEELVLGGDKFLGDPLNSAPRHAMVPFDLRFLRAALHSAPVPSPSIPHPQVEIYNAFYNAFLGKASSSCPRSTLKRQDLEPRGP